MPSLIRLLVFVAAIVAVVYAAMFAIVSYVEPQPREMTQTIPPARLNAK